MKPRQVWSLALVVLASASACRADVVIERWGGQGPYAHAGAMKLDGDSKITFDLSALPDGAKPRWARLYAFRAPSANNADDALVDIEIAPEGGKPLVLVGPWFDCFDVPPAAPFLKKGKSLVLNVKAFPAWQPERTFLEIAYDGQPDAKAPTVKDVKAVHQAGQTFVTWSEIEAVEDDKPTWGKLKGILDKAEQERPVRYRVYAADRPITAGNLAEATLLGEVGPLSGYNVNGRSPDQAFQIMRKRMLTDMDYAKQASKNYYSIPASAHDEVVIDRFVIPQAGELPNGTGLYVQHPTKAGKSYYAVTVIQNGREGTAGLRAGANVVGPVEETVGKGGPVLQRLMDLKVLFDYAGSRTQYVQWTAPPLSNLPDQYYNWSIFVPDGLKMEARPFPVELFFSGNGMYRRPRWPTRSDTILLSPHDAPFVTWYYGYPDNQGTLKSLKGSTIQPYTWRRMLALLDWMFTRFDVQPSMPQACINRAQITCSGDRGYAATAALHFGLRHPEVFSLVYTCKGMPNPGALPTSVKSDNRVSVTPAGELERLIGKKDWHLKTDTGQDVWEFFNLTAEVAKTPQVLRPLLAHGGRGGWDWPPTGEFFQAMQDARQYVTSRGEWGEVDPAGLKNPGVGRYGLDVRSDRPIPVFTKCSSDYQGGRNGDGGSTNIGVWWDDASIVDTADKFEITLTGNVTADVTPRRMKNFTIKSGQQVSFRVSGAARDGKPTDRAGQATADANGLVTIPQVPVAGRTQLVITRTSQ